MASLGADIAANGTRERSSETLKYYQLAVSMLRQRLTDESQRSSDAVVATLSNLCGFEAMSGRFDAVDMHTQGIRHVVTLRGGPDRLGEDVLVYFLWTSFTDDFCLGFDGFLRTIAVAWLNFYASRQYIASHKESLIPADGILTYPTHPFDPDLCSVIAKFPPGIMNIALSSQLSHQIIVMISRVNAWGQEVATSLREKDIYRLNYLSHNSKNITLSGQFLLHPNLSLVEQLLTLGLLGFCYSHDDTRSFYWITKAYLQVRCRHLNSVSIDVSDKNEDFMTWVGSVLVSMGDPTSEVWILGLKLLDSRPTPRDWQANVNICETFFWTDSMSLRLSSKIGYLRQKRRV
ncbi:hypothetical protein PV08_05642 [Exophiala spinifera]|uniref:Transcription factor domain-containing protein n=1 Tax=Exophiala spinifera TaxID=91928 RepID=A0A0D2BWF9_9EURO|nr:uncharacterized protein PV08_05642 [Exophiala spinifera]KIW15594.1 hypothetical protein PV08_05642 [Exophiala spinifera]